MYRAEAYALPARGVLTGVSQDTLIRFNRPHTVGTEAAYVADAIANGHLSGNGPFAGQCAAWLEQRTGCAKALLTHSATGALEMCALLAGLEAGDEVIMPSFTFVSTANAVALRGAVPVFVDVRSDTFNLDETLVEAAITPRTRAVLAVHYAGVACAMDELTAICARHGLMLIEDAAQAILSSYRGRPLGSIGSVAALSFHETKNVMCGEGGALLVNDPELISRAEIVHEKGTDRSRFFRGQVDKYTWVDVGSSFLLSDLACAFLFGQLEHAEAITQARMSIWERYHAAFDQIEQAERARRPVIPADAQHNAHMYYLVLESLEERQRFIAELADRQVMAVFHYSSLHLSSAGERFGRAHGELPVTESVSERLVRLPLWVDMTEEQVERVVEATLTALAPTTVARR